MHVHEVPDAPAEQRLPLLVLVTQAARVVVVEGAPHDEDLKEAIRRLLSMPGEAEAERQ